MPGRLRDLVSLVQLSLVTRAPFRFLLRQALRREGPKGYRLRGSGLRIFLRHGTPDVAAVEQVFRLGHYEPPAEVNRALDGRAAPFVVDLGANVGAFGAWLLSRFDAAGVVALEADPGNAAVHRLATDSYKGSGSWTLVEASAAAADGTARFLTGMYTNSRLAEADEDAVSVPARDVFRWLERADLVKIDIEGAEWDLLMDPRFASIPATVVALEYHPERCPGADPRNEAVKAVERAGFAWREADFVSSERHGMIWAWKSA